MLEETLAKKLIERVSEYTSYNVNIMNEDGIIIASVDPKRVGTFHEAAYVITHNDRDVIMVNMRELHRELTWSSRSMEKELAW